jgi:hypothetical protein
MFEYLRATRLAGVVGLAAMLVLAARASARSMEPAAIGPAMSAVRTAGLSLESVRHTVQPSGHLAEACPKQCRGSIRAEAGDAERGAVLGQQAAHCPWASAAARVRRADPFGSGLVERDARDVFSHGLDFAGRISAAGYDWAEAGDNIATGFATPGAVVRSWMADPGHCQNILNPSYRDLGVGVNGHPAAGAASAPATWTEDFGLRMFPSPGSSNWGPANGLSVPLTGAGGSSGTS